MSRSSRLLDLIQLLRSHRRPVSGQVLADSLGISLRTLYRDIATLQAQGAVIEGEPGVGYVLRAGYLLPPLMFTEEEIEALVLGSRWVAERSCSGLDVAAKAALTKIAAVLPADIRDRVDGSPLLVGPGEETSGGGPEIAAIRRAIRAQSKVEIGYRDAGQTNSQRIVWPFAVGFFDRVRVVMTWCELRQSFRSFRIDRIASWVTTETRYPCRRQDLLKEWRELERIPPQ
jgi:predicted DNA-binding transcriptional regulator YafY